MDDEILKFERIAFTQTSRRMPNVEVDGSLRGTWPAGVLRSMRTNVDGIFASMKYAASFHAEVEKDKGVEESKKRKRDRQGAVC